MLLNKIVDHAAYRRRLHSVPVAALFYIIKDAKEAMKANPENPNNGYYADEVCYAGMELNRRRKTA
jgi:hypothetical protein